MNRRSLIQGLFALLGIPSGVVGGTSLTQAGGMTEIGIAPIPGVLTAPPPWLVEWLRLPMLPVVSQGDLDANLHPRARDLASWILSRTGGDKPLVFHYNGGTEPGMVRSVLPVLLFRKFDPAVIEVCAETIEHAPGPIYLLAHCETRGAARTFRLDRMELVLG